MMDMLDLFAGIGGFSVAAHWTGAIRTVGFVYTTTGERAWQAN